jgi:hypothetical protein
MIETPPLKKIYIYFFNVKPDRDSNLGPSEYGTAALLTKLCGRLQTTSPPQIHVIREQLNTVT